MLMKTRGSNAQADWDSCKLARNECLNIIKHAKRAFYSNCFENKHRKFKGDGENNQIIDKCKEVLYLYVNLDDGSNEQVAETFNDYFTLIGNELRMLMLQQVFDISKLKTFVSSRKSDAVNFCISSIDDSFILENLHSMKGSKAAGFDKISARMLKIAALVIVPSLAKLMNISIRSKQQKLARYINLEIV